MSFDGAVRGNRGHVRVIKRIPPTSEETTDMGVEARTGLLLAATACLLAVMVDWIITELD
jgi:hypothetical protein